MVKMPVQLLMPFLALLLAAASPPLPAEFSDPMTTEWWIWQQVQAGKIANLNDRCGTEPLDIHRRDDASWRAPCRRVDPALLRMLLTQPDLEDHTPHGVQIVGARIDGALDLDDAHVRGAELSLERSWIAGDVVLNDARLDGLLSLSDTLIEGELRGLRVSGSTMLMDRTEFSGPVDLNGAHVAQLHLNKARFGGPVYLNDGRVEGLMSMFGASVAAEQMFHAQALHVRGLSLRKTSFGGPVDLKGAHVEIQLNMVGSIFKEELDVERLHVDGDILAGGATFEGVAKFALAVVDGSLDLRDSHLWQIDLAGAVIRDDLILGGRLHWDACVCQAPSLNLRNLKVGSLNDDERAWPERITLEGFTYKNLGGFGQQQNISASSRPTSWWRAWLNRDPVYSAQPYVQLASVLATAGNRDGAADIRFFGRDRERSELLQGCTWLQKLGLEKPDHAHPCGWERWGTWAGLTALQYFVGYGIGNYAFRAVVWAVALALIGMVILWFTPGVRDVRPGADELARQEMSGHATDQRAQSVEKRDRHRTAWFLSTAVWCFGASLHRVLPLVTISQEFSEFFNDPKRERLYAWQHFAFGILALCGWALGLFVVVAFSGLTQS